MHVAIIGNGISGITAARWIRKLSDFKISVISSESEHFYSRTALMYIYMGHMRFEDTKPYEDWFWEKNNIDLIHRHVVNIDFKRKSIQYSSGNDTHFDKLILAVGSKSNKFGWPGQDLNGVSGLYHLKDVEEMEKYSAGLHRAVIVGGGLIGIEMAEMFHSRHIPVTMIVREVNYWDNVLPIEEAKIIGNHIRKHGIDLRLSSNLKEIIDDGKGNVGGIIIKETGEEIECGFVGLTPGVSPNIDFLKSSLLETDRGILADKYLRTNIPDVYAIGDCVQLKDPPHGRKSIEAVWYTGRMMGETAAYNICGHKAVYDPGIWFNSAKFLDIEYQVYGDVPRVVDHPLESFTYAEEHENLFLRLVYHSKDQTIVGINVLGMRLRHEVCEKWLKEKSHINDVIENFALANFDPEFYKSYEKDITSAFNKATGQNLQSKAKRNLSSVIKYLVP